MHLYHETSIIYEYLYGQNYTSGGREGDEHEATCSSEELEVFQGPIPRGEAKFVGRHLARSDDCLFSLDKLNISYSRSSGPGGQNVNKCM